MTFNTANPAAPRVAYFPDSFHEVNGVAHTSRHFVDFARRRNLPFLCVRAGSRSPALVEEGNLWTLELPRSFFSFALERDLRYDPAYLRHLPLIRKVMQRFRPDIVHITGPSELGMIGAGLAHWLHVPLAASWHTNVHEYLARRSGNLLHWLPQQHAQLVTKIIEDTTMSTTALFYSAARVLFAPNVDLCAQLEESTGRPCFLMQRGVDAQLFHPEKRDRALRNRAPQNREPQNREMEDNQSVLGFVGRLSVEKNIQLLATIQNQLESMGNSNFRFLIVGHGNEEAWLRERLPRAEFTGVLRGEALSQAYANMDLFVFPSHTDTFGNVVLEALASGVPAIVTPDGGPATIVREGVTGRIAKDEDFAAAIAAVLADPQRHAQMRQAARAQALTMGWDSIFEGIYSRYATILPAKHQHAEVSKDTALPQEG